MVLPIIIGVGATIIALTAKSTIAAVQKFRWLTPAMIASLNNIRIENPTTSIILKDGKPHPHHKMHEFLRSKYPLAGFGEPITEQEALSIMGIEGDDILNLNKEMLKSRYRKLMVMNHPDKNGSQYITQKINQAKEILDKSYMINK